MDSPNPTDRTLSYLESQLREAAWRGGADEIKPFAAIALSRQAGARAVSIAQATAVFLNALRPNRTREEHLTVPPWTVFDRSLVDLILAEHHLPERLEVLFREDAPSYFKDALAELTGLMPTSTEAIQHLVETILRLAYFGHTIMVGRGCTRIVRDVPHVLRVRLVGSLERRVAHVMEHLGLDRAAAAHYVADHDTARSRYLRTHFDMETDDPLGYHLVLNTDHLTNEQAGEILGRAALALADES